MTIGLAANGLSSARGATVSKIVQHSGFRQRTRVHTYLLIRFSESTCGRRWKIRSMTNTGALVQSEFAPQAREFFGCRILCTNVFL